MSYLDYQSSPINISRILLLQFKWFGLITKDNINTKKNEKKSKVSIDPFQVAIGRGHSENDARGTRHPGGDAAPGWQPEGHRQVSEGPQETSTSGGSARIGQSS